MTSRIPWIQAGRAAINQLLKKALVWRSTAWLVESPGMPVLGLSLWTTSCRNLSIKPTTRQSTTALGGPDCRRYPTRHAYVTDVIRIGNISDQEKLFALFRLREGLATNGVRLMGRKRT